jgi:tetratricopeptide (TPR) repeat protein
MWDWLLIEDNRAVLSWLGGGVVVAVGGLWTVYVYFRKSAKTFSPTPAPITTIQSGGDTVVGPGTIDKRKYYGINDIELAKQLGVAEYAVTNFFNILDQQHIPIEKWDLALRQLAERYIELQQRAAELDSEDPNVQALQTQAREAIDAAEFEQAEALLDKAVDLDNAAAEKFQVSHLKRRCSAAASQALKAKSLHTRFALPEAIAAYKQSIELAQQGKDEGRVAEYRWGLGLTYVDQADYHQAIVSYELALKYLLLEDGASPNVALLWNNLGVAWSNKGDYDQAIDYLDKALAVDIDTFGEDDPSVTRDWNSLGLAWSNKGDYDKAINYYEKALAVSINTFGEEHPKVATLRNNLGNAWLNKGNYDKAIDYYEKALTVDIDTFGEDHPKVAMRWNNLGIAWLNKGDYDQAIDYLDKALAVDIDTFGEGHPNVAGDWNNLGNAWSNKGEYDRAIDYYEKALTVGIKAFGEEHPKVAIYWNNLGYAWLNKGNYKQAIDYYEKALTVRIKFLGDDHPETLQTIKNMELAKSKMVTP